MAQVEMKPHNKKGTVKTVLNAADQPLAEALLTRYATVWATA